jgi:hypothetical protein
MCLACELSEYLADHASAAAQAALKPAVSDAPQSDSSLTPSRGADSFVESSRSISDMASAS